MFRVDMFTPNTMFRVSTSIDSHQRLHRDPAHTTQRHIVHTWLHTMLPWWYHKRLRIHGVCSKQWYVLLSTTQPGTQSTTMAIETLIPLAYDITHTHTHTQVVCYNMHTIRKSQLNEHDELLECHTCSLPQAESINHKDAYTPTTQRYTQLSMTHAHTLIYGMGRLIHTLKVTT